MKRPLACLVLLLSLILTGCSEQAQDVGDGGWYPLFNGTDLDGWARLNGEATYTVENDEIVGTTTMNTPNTFLATEETYGDFILELELNVDPAINSGIQIRSESTPEYMDGRVHGYQIEIDPAERAWSGGVYDEARRGWLYPLDPNSACRAAFKNNAWNQYRIEAIGPSIRTWVNGVACADLVDDMTAEGFIALQVHSVPSEDLAGKQVRWRNLRIQTENLEPSAATNIPVVNLMPNTLSPQEEAQGWTSLFDGESFAHWTVPEGDNGHWQVLDGVIDYDALSEAEEDKNLWSQKEYGDFMLKLDWRIKEHSGLYPMPTILPDGSSQKDENGEVITEDLPNADSGVYVRGTSKAQINIWCWPVGSGEVYGYRTDEAMPPEVRAGVTPKLNADKPVGEWNQFVITMRGDRLTVFLNGRLVIDNAQLPDVPERGPIAFQHHGEGKPNPASSLVQFRSIAIKQL